MSQQQEDFRSFGIIDGNENELFDHWRKIPVLQRVSEPERMAIGKPQIRNEILTIMRDGLTDGNKKRHALTAKEIKSSLEDRFALEQEIGLSKLYYHLDKMIEGDFIRHMSIVHGNNKTRYYYRTAKFFLYDTSSDNRSKFFEKFMDTGIPKLIRHYNPKISKEKMENDFERLFDRMELFDSKVTNWMEKNHLVLQELDIDPLTFFLGLNYMAVIDPDTGAVMKDLAHYFNFFFQSD